MSPTSPSGFSCFLCDGALASFIILMGLPRDIMGFSWSHLSHSEADLNITRWLAGELVHSGYSCFSPAGLDTENSGPHVSNKLGDSGSV